MSAVLHIYNSHPLRDFLNERGGCASHEATVTAMGTELKGKWLIPDNDYPRFLDLLHDYLFVKKARSLNLVEQPRVNHHKPLLLDLDFRYSSDSAINRTFTDSNIKAFCEDVVKGLEHFFGLEDYEDGIRFFVTLRPAPYQEQGKKERKDGVHIECPDICLSNEKQKVLRLWLLNRKSVQTCFAGTGYINKDEDVYDESMTRKQGWFFFGESKPNIPRYELKNVICYNAADQTFSSEDVGLYNSRDLMEILSVRYNLTDDGNVVREEVSAEYQALLNPPVTFQAPQGGDGPAPEANVTENAYAAAVRAIAPIVDRSEEESDLIKSLVLQCLSVERADNRDTWMRVGWCLHNLQPNEEMFNLWMEFSAKSSKFTENSINSLRRDWFSNMRKAGDGPRLTEMSLHKWARDDNPTAYREILDANILEYIRRFVDATHFHIARLMKKLYGNNYVASLTEKTTDWFYYDDSINLWKQLSQGIQLRTKISGEVAEYIGRARDKIRKDMNNAKTEDERGPYNTKMEKLTKVEMHLYNTGFTDSVMKMASTFFFEEDFRNKLDANVYLYGCKNGILELRAVTDDNPKEHTIFRPGRPEDFVSFRAGNNPPKSEAMDYIPYKDFNKEQKEQLAFVKDFFAKIFPDPELRTYVQRLLASCLEGTNREQCYYTFIGEGSNGKSVLINLCEITFGDYFTTLPTTVLTRKRPESGSANPEIIVIKNRRFISMQEPDEKEPINTSRMKQFSGEDLIEARALFQNQEKFRATGKLFMMTNKLPPINSMDYGTWRRVRAVPFKSKFISQDHPDWGKPNHFLKDKEYEKKLHPCREVFFSWLVHLYETEYLVHGLEPVPAAVKKETDDYREGFDSFAKFRNDRIERAPGEKTLFKHIANAYREWLADGNRTGSRLAPKELEKRLNSEFGEPTDGKTYNHIKLKVDDDENESSIV
jgi:P4 family phage/plasmid primase-like protien